MQPHVTIDVPDRWESVPVGEVVSLRLLIERPADRVGTVRIRGVRHRDESVVSLNTDLLPRDVTLSPGDRFALSVGVRFATPGSHNLSRMLVQVDPVDDSTGVGNQLVPLPAHPFQVVPSIEREVAITLARICRYDDGVKVEVTVHHTGATDWQAFELSAGPEQRVRSGVTRHHKPVLRPGDRTTFELIVGGESVEFGTSGTTGGVRVDGRRTLAIPGADDRAVEYAPFTFLEPRSLTTDRIDIVPEAGGAMVVPVGGVFPVFGAKARYLVKIHSSDSRAQEIELFEAPGQVEVEKRKQERTTREFLVTVVENPVLTQPIRMYYDVNLPDQTLRGELHLSIRPTSAKLWTIALTAGAAVTLKGATAFVPALLNPDSAFDEVMTEGWALLNKRGLDLLQLASIFFIRGGLWAVDRIWRPIQEG
ncbi:hypothetical protein [Fimbriiglobus ruber]|uniref:Uncharacterized protein n=1 Tax=Fimbriiglobus ruber TaxID=1908690 RepID=A0A225E0G3_9BACT|nr:hypothetical protein [Fimbriiglobus ruber]OWK46693.1 hypothetical protein FRUB_00392 [Fimbriiglobus ruber]